MTTTVPEVAARPRLPVEKLDKSRTHAEVFGPTQHSIAFAQRAMGVEGWPYDAHGDLIEAALNDHQREVLAKRREQAAKNPKPPVPEQVEAIDEDIVDEEVTESKEPADDPTEDINLVQWLKAEVRYRPLDVQNAVKKRYGVNKPSTQAIALYLVEEKKLLPRQQVHSSILPRPK